VLIQRFGKGGFDKVWLAKIQATLLTPLVALEILIGGGAQTVKATVIEEQ
jgi:hypothetical protein